MGWMRHISLISLESTMSDKHQYRANQRRYGNIDQMIPVA